MNLNKPTSYPSVCLTEFFQRKDIKNLSFIRSWNQVPWILGGLDFMGSSPKQNFGQVPVQPRGLKF